MDIETRVLQGRACLQKSGQLTRTGFPYFLLRYEGDDAGYPSHFAIWHNELEWFVESLDVIATRLLHERFTQPGLYPLLGNINANGGLYWFIAVRDDGRRHLVIRRYVDSFSRDEERMHTRFFEFSRHGRFPQQVQWPFHAIAQGYLRNFARACREALCTERERIWREVSRVEGREVPDILHAFRRIAIRVSIGGKKRRILLPPGFDLDSHSEFEVLSDDPQVLVLGLCAIAATAAEVSTALRHTLDAEALRDLTCWTRRYDPSTLRQGYLFTITNGQRVVAIRDRSLFASDPLLLSLGNLLPPHHEGLDSWISTPQCTPAQFEAAQARGWVKETAVTAFGRVPLPTRERQDAIRPFVRPPAVLGIHRWKILQLLDLQSASACNLQGGIVNEPVVHLQVLALLANDVRCLFEDGTDSAATTFLEHAQRRFQSILMELTQPAACLPLPRKGRAAA